MKGQTENKQEQENLKWAVKGGASNSGEKKKYLIVPRSDVRLYNRQ